MIFCCFCGSGMSCRRKRSNNRSPYCRYRIFGVAAFPTGFCFKPGSSATLARSGSRTATQPKSTAEESPWRRLRAKGLSKAARPAVWHARAYPIDRWIFVSMAIWFIAVILTGFIPDSLTKITAGQAGERPPFPLVPHFHAVLMATFVLLVPVQTTLIVGYRPKADISLGSKDRAARKVTALSITPGSTTRRAQTLNYAICANGRRRPRIARPIPPNPRSIIAHVAGSGTEPTGWPVG